MALTTSELYRCQYELGYSLLSSQQPYIGTTNLFRDILSAYVLEGASTTSSTTVTAADTPTAVTITLADASEIVAFDRLVVDVDELQEFATVRAISGNDVTVILSGAHTGTYPVTVEAGDAIAREILAHIRKVKDELSSTFGEGALKQVDEISFYQAGGMTLFGTLGDQLKFWRDELASVLGVENLWSVKRRAGSTMSVY